MAEQSFSSVEDQSGRLKKGDTAMAVKTKLALSVALILGTTSLALAKTPAPTEPYGTDAEQTQCIANTEAGLHGSSVLGPRGTPEYYQDRGNLDSEGLTEEDLILWHCMNKFYHRYTKLHGGQTQ
jgi:hypothetical protein